MGGIHIKRNLINSLLIIFTLFLCMSLVGAACAAEDVNLNNDATNGIDDVLGTTSDSSDVASVNEGSLLDNSQTSDILSTTHDLSGSTFDDIQRYLNNNVGEGDSVYLGNASFTGSTPINLNIANVAIYGGTSSNPDVTSTLIASGSRIFNINAAGIILNNLIFIDGSNQNSGGAIEINGGITGTKINECSFIGNHALGNQWGSGGTGGAINCNGNDLSIYKSKFINNSAINSGAIEFNGNSLIVSDSTFINNIATENMYGNGGTGGAINCNRGSLTITNSQFVNNGAIEGGAIKFNGNSLTVSDSTFEDNVASENMYGNGGNGAAISCNGNRLEIDNSKFIANTGINGASVYATNNVLSSKINNSTFSNNTGKVNKYGNGGSAGITYCGSDLSIVDSNFINNNASNGAAISLENTASNIVIDNCNFDNNNAVKTLVISQYQDPYYAGGNGGAISTNGNDVIISNSLFTNNAAENGGAIYGGSNAGNYLISNATFINNNATIAGGAVKTNGYNWKFKQSNFTNNTAYGETNVVSNGGGAIWTCDSISTVNSTYFEGNKAPYGGAIRGAVNMYNSTFVANIATDGNGGGIDFTIDATKFGDMDQVVGIYNCTFEENEALGSYVEDDRSQGGAIHIYQVKGVEIDDVDCHDNYAYRGGAIDLYVQEYATISNSNIKNNNATLGGGISVVGDNCSFINLNLSSNIAKDNGSFEGQGGGIWVDGSKANFKDSVLDENAATYGGGIYVNGADGKFTNNILINNDASKTGGGVFVNGENAKFTNNNVSSNTAEDYGGGIFVSGDDLYIEDMYAFNNTACNGGFAAIQDCENLIVKDVNAISNHATGDVIADDKGEGGAFHLINASNADIQGNFEYNTAINGSAIYVQNSVVKVHDTRFFDNQAHSYLLNITPVNNTQYNTTDVINISVSHQGGDNIANAIHNKDKSDITINNITYPFYTIDGQEINKITPTNDVTPIYGAENSDDGRLLYEDDFENNQIINIVIKDENNNIVKSYSNLKTDIYGTVYVNITGLKPGNYTVEAVHPEDTYYTIISNSTNFEIVGKEIINNMTVEKISLNSTDVIYIGDVVAFNITVRNTGECVLSNVNVTEYYNDSEYNYVDYSNKKVWSKEGDVFKYGLDLGIGESTTFTIWFKTLTNGTLVNNVVASSNSTDNKTANNNTTVNPICDLEITKLVNNSKVYVNDNVEWTIIVKNNGPSVAENVVVKDTLPQNIEIVSATTIYGTFDESTSSWNVGSLDSGAEVSLILITKLLKVGSFTNVVAVSTDTIESDYTNNEANNTTSADPICDVKISKSVNSSSIYVGETVKWNITVVNIGPSVAENVVVEDTLPQGAEIVSAESTTGNFDFNTRIWEVGELGVNTPVSLILITKISVEGNVTNMVEVTTSTPESNKSNNKVNNTTFAKPICDLEVTKLVNASNVYQFNVVEWTIIVKNKGPSDALNVVVNDTLPQGVEFISSTLDYVSFNDNNLIWHVGNLESGKSVTIKVKTEILELGNWTNVVNVTTSTPESNYTNNNANNTTSATKEDIKPAVLNVDLKVTKSSDKTTYKVNDTMHWIITVDNDGPSAATNVNVSDVLPAGTEYISHKTSQGVYDSTTGIWTIGGLNVGETVTLDITCKVITEGNITNDVNVSCSENDTNKSNNFDNATIEVIGNETPVDPDEPDPIDPDDPVDPDEPDPIDPVDPVNPDEPVTPKDSNCSNAVVSMRNTGNPLAYLVISMIVVFSSFWSRNRKE